MKHTTGMTRQEIEYIADLAETFHQGPIPECPPSISTFLAIRITATYWYTNRTQWDLAETFSTSQATISRTINAATHTLAAILRQSIPVREDLHEDAVYVVDGTLLPCWSWRGHTDLYSGKHKTTGHNVQIAVTLAGQVAWVSDPFDGCRHDMHALTQSEVLSTLDPRQWIGDKGYLGSGIHTPTRKPQSRDLTESEKQGNSSINKIRWIVERGVAHLKNWNILATDYRRPLETFARTLTATLGLFFHLQAG